MRRGDYASGPAKLANAWKTLRAHWELTRLDWNDAVAREFEEKCLGMLEPRINSTLERMRIVAQVFGSAENECER